MSDFDEYEDFIERNRKKSRKAQCRRFTHPDTEKHLNRRKVKVGYKVVRERKNIREEE